MILEIDGEHSGIRFSACHFIPKHEKCSRLHGHSYVLRFRLEGEIGELGMVMDFVDLKTRLKEFIEKFDHRILLPRRSQYVQFSEKENSIEVTSCGKKYVFPKEEVVFLDVSNTTAEEMAMSMVNKIVENTYFPPCIRSVSIGLDEERGQTVWCTKELNICQNL
ncbi:MAG: 6-pyruvoyl tetrahydropterin synthase family protein [archaeon]|nr:6-pyruvoyl tetrahydropterin synthase family protein [archaeon]